jgi:glucose/arabinose dehydrogenase
MNPPWRDQPFRWCVRAAGTAALSLAAAACAASSTSAAGGSGTTSGAGATGGASGATASPAITSPAPAGNGALSPAARASTRVTLTVPAGNGGGSLSTPRTLLVPAGWTAEVWARVPNARMEAWTPGGDLLISIPNSGDVIELVPRAHRAARPASRTVLSRLTQPQGLAFGTVNGREVLYVAESDEIDRYPWAAGRVAGTRTVVAGHLPDLDSAGDDVHRAKDVVLGPDGTVYFNVGSSSNANPDDRWSSPQRADIMSVRPDGSDLRVVARGIRNGEGLSIAPDKTLWSAINERDNITFPFRRSYLGYSDAFGQQLAPYVSEHPPDEVVRATQGRDVGWPYCDPDQDVNTPAGSMAGLPLVADAVTNPGGKRLDCSALPRVNVGLPAHSAPLGFHFLEGSRLPAQWSGGAVVTVHGSWDRQPPRAPAVLWMAWNPAARTLEPAVMLIGGFQDADGRRWGRPADAVAGPDGALYVSDDTAGAIYRLMPPTTAG